MRRAESVEEEGKEASEIMPILGPHLSLPTTKCVLSISSAGGGLAFLSVSAVSKLSAA
ncbi:unnamed protein product [Caretta caretta]